MARDDIRRERERRESRENSSKRRRERSYDKYTPDVNSSHYQNYKSLCVRKISLNFDVDYVQEQLHKAFSSFGDFDIRTFKSSDRRLAIIQFRHSDDAHRAFKSKKQVYIGDRSFSVEIWDDKESLVGGRHERSKSPHSSSKPTSSSVHRSFDFDDRSRSPLRSSSRRPYNFVRSDRQGSMDREILNDPKVTRTLFVGSLEPDITDAEVRHAFERCGGVEHVDVKRPNNVHAYAFVRFVNLDMALQAKMKMNGNSIRSYHCKIGYGKPLPSNVLYISGLDNWRDSEELKCFISQFGPLVKLDWQYRHNYAITTFPSIEVAEEVSKQLKNLATRYPDRKLMVDFIGGEITEVLPQPRQSSLIPLPNAFPLQVQELIPGLRGNPLGFPNQLMATAFDLMRGGPEPNPALFPTVPPIVDDSRHRRNIPPRQMESNATNNGRINAAVNRRQQAPLSQSSLFSSRFGRGASPIDSFLRPDMSDLSDPVLSSITTMTDLEAFLRPNIWNGKLYTKKSLFRFRCFHVVGDDALSKEIAKNTSFVSSSSNGELSFQMPQQARTDVTWMADAIEQIRKALGDSSSSSPCPFSVLLALPSSQELEPCKEKQNDENVRELKVGEWEEEGAKIRPLTCLVSYLRRKQRTGFLTPFSNDPDGDESKYTILLLTPSSFSLSLLKFSAPRLCSGLAFVDDFLVLLLLRNCC